VVEGSRRSSFFEFVQEREDSVGRRSELANDLAIIRILLLLERSSRFIDKAQALRDFLALGVGDPKDTANRRGFLFRFPPSRFAVSMPFLARVSHIS
jgi:hypothetical protein